MAVFQVPVMNKRDLLSLLSYLTAVAFGFSFAIVVNAVRFKWRDLTVAMGASACLVTATLYLKISLGAS